MKTKLLSFLIALLLIISAFSSVFVFAGNSKYTDVKDSDWFAGAVYRVSDEGIMAGVGAGLFAPGNNLTRSMFAQILYKFSGESFVPPSESAFTDIVPGAWYYTAVCWAKEKGVVSGTSEVTFSPDMPITREQIASMLIRYTAAMFMTDPISDVGKFADDGKISSWAYDSVYTAKGANYIGGKPGNLFDPKANATRAEAAQMISNYEDNVLKIRLAEEIAVPIAGLSREYTLFHLTDTHLAVADEQDSAAIHEYCNNRTSLFLTESPGGYKSEERFADFFKYAKTAGADNIIMTGDNIDCPSHGNFSFIESVINESGLLDKTLYCFGNHDWNFCDESERTEKIEQYKNEFSYFFGSEEQTVQVHDMGEFVILAVANDNYQVDYKALDTLTKYAYADDERPVIVMLHVPLFTETIVNDTIAKWGRIITMGSVSSGYTQYIEPTATTQSFVNICEDKSGNVALVLAGHVHFDHVDTLPGGTPQIVTGAGFDGSCRIIRLVGEN